MGGTPGDLGGFAGISYPLNPASPGFDHFWLAGTVNGYGVVDLIDDGAWHHYSIALDGTSLGSFHLILEDFDGSGGVAGDALFDNISLAAVPEPSAASCLVLGVLALGIASRRINFQICLARSRRHLL